MPKAAGPLWVVLFVHLAFAGAAAARLRGPYSRSYGYSQHGRDWELGACATGRQQSPIDLPLQGTGPPSGSVFYDYRSGSASAILANDGHAYSLNLFGQEHGGVLYGGAWYALLGAALHVASEHTWAGRSAPAELHLVHKRHDAGTLLVVAAALSCAHPPVPRPPAAHAAPSAAAPGFNRLVQVFTAAPPPPVDSWANVSMASALDLNAVLQGGLFFAYAGSMTVPPCAEVVTWLVRAEPLAMSDEQAQCLQDMVLGITAGRGNRRSTMPLNGRNLSLVSAVQQPRAAPVQADHGILGSGATDREVRVAAKADEALRVAAGITKYLKGVEGKVLRAAHAGMNSTTS